MRRPALAGVAAVAALLLTGCVQMPDSGPVTESHSDTRVSAGSGVYINPRPPQQGASTTDIVRGFLAAMQATPIQTKTAREFLSDEAAASWDPQQQTVTYAVPPTPRETQDGVAVTLDEPDRLDSRGAWQGELPVGQRTIRFPMVLVDGEWRIDAAPNALIVPEGWFEDNYQPVSLYFFDPTASILAPEPVYVPRGQTLASTLTRSLLLGPGDGMDRVIQSFIPSGLKIAVGVAVSDDGIANISLTGDAGTLTSDAVGLMMAQFAWTLRQDPSVTGIKVSIDGEPLPLPGGMSSYRIDGGAEYDPAGFRASPLLYGLRDGVLASATTGALTAVSGPMGTDALGLRSVGVDVDATTAAGVTDDGRSVIEAPVSSSDDGRPRTVFNGTDLLAPRWDFADRMWLVDQTADGAEVSWVRDGRSATVDVPGVTGEQVRAFLVSRDGTRFVAVVRRPSGDSLMISRIAHSRSGRVLWATSARRISTDSDTQLPVRAIAWRTSSSIALLNPFTTATSQVRSASVDGSPAGSDTPAATVQGRLRYLAGSPVLDERLFGITSGSLIDLTSPDHRSVPLSDGVDAVTYAG
ncbi:LpqB family beta-propeller domain-containing protein [Nocardioides sp. CN2-186]|uniref:LpqB family beta-propeller domain-containing protein n=1 Tax=Nocardioides tweenelious TaxID=3156607 RepID=UPI0032B4A8DC